MSFPTQVIIGFSDGGLLYQTDEVSEEMGKCFGMQVQVITGINNVRQLLQCNYWIIENARVL